MIDKRVWADDGTRPILDAIYEVYSQLGPGLLESVYERALMIELKSRGIKAQNQVPINASYKGQDLGLEFVVDILVEDKFILELKSVEELHPVYKKQLLTYLKLSDKHLGFLVNFNQALLKDGIKRIANNFVEPKQNDI